MIAKLFYELINIENLKILGKYLKDSWEIFEGFLGDIRKNH